MTVESENPPTVDVTVPDVKSSKKKKNRKPKKKKKASNHNKDGKVTDGKTNPSCNEQIPDIKSELGSTLRRDSKMDIQECSLFLKSPRIEYYQTSSSLVVNIFQKGLVASSLKSVFEDNLFSISYGDIVVAYKLWAEISPELSFVKVMSKKVEIFLAKSQIGMWDKMGDAIDNMGSTSADSSAPKPVINKEIPESTLFPTRAIKLKPRIYRKLDFSLADSDDELDAEDSSIYKRAGLINLGTTCYVNTIIQALATVGPLCEYFETDDFKRDINLNNPLSVSRGEVTIEFAKLLRALAASEKPLNPKSFLSCLYTYSSLFHMHTQHDAHEFLSWLLDTVHEEVNLVQSKAYIELPDYDDATPDQTIASEYWNAHKRRNDSVIVEHFHGQYKSKITCTECGKNSIKFDAFMSLSVELPPTRMNRTFRIVTEKHQILKVRFTVSDTCSLATLGERILHLLNLEDDMYEIFHALLDESGRALLTYQLQIPSDLPLCSIEARYNVEFLFYIGQRQKTYVLATTMCVSDQKELCYAGLPLLLCLETDEATTETAEQEILHHLGRKYETSTENATVYDEQGNSFADSHVLLARNRLACAHIVWDDGVSPILRPSYEENAEISEMYSDPEVSEILSTPLKECIKLHVSEEEVEEWYCPGCKKHQRGRKKLDLWKLPKFLIVPLKRFYELAPEQFLKRECLVEFPLEDLDLSDFILGPDKRGIYDVIALSDHYGCMGSGHYTAKCRVGAGFVRFDDDLKEELSLDDVIGVESYVIFLKRRDS